MKESSTTTTDYVELSSLTSQQQQQLPHNHEENNNPLAAQEEEEEAAVVVVSVVPTPTPTPLLPPSNNSKPPRLYQLDGFRFLVAFWLVLAHNFSEYYNEVGTIYERFCMRRYFGVQFFLVLSGFVSNYAYGRKFTTSSATETETTTADAGETTTTTRRGEVLMKFYIGRIGSILACYYFTQFWALAIRCAANHYTFQQYLIGIPLSLLLLQSWIPKYSYFGNTPSWTLSTLATLWIVYPYLQIYWLNTWSTLKVFRMLVLVPFVAMIPAFLALWFFGDGHQEESEEAYALTNNKIWYALYTHPVFRFPDFFFGCLLSELYVRRWLLQVNKEATEEENKETESPTTTTATTTITTTIINKLLSSSSSAPFLADLATLVLILLIIAVPYQQRTSIYDTIMIEGPMILFGALIYFGSCPPLQASWSGYIMSLPICQRLGDFAFQVYLFRWPIFAMLSWYEHGFLKKGHLFLSWPMFILGCFLLYIVSYIWYLKVDTPFRTYLTTKRINNNNNNNNSVSSQPPSTSAAVLATPFFLT